MCICDDEHENLGEYPEIEKEVEHLEHFLAVAIQRLARQKRERAQNFLNYELGPDVSTYDEDPEC